MSSKVPNLRFDGFSGEWEEKLIGKLFNTFSGGTPLTTNKNYYGGAIPFIRSAEINKSQTELFVTNDGVENSSAKYVKQGDVLYALYGANSGDVAISKINGVINQAILCLDSEKASNQFLYYCLAHLKTKIINQYIQGGQGNLSGDIVKSLEVGFPKNKEEQQKIANCLSSLDNLIESQNKKVKALENHKKGLLQNLFPKDEEKEPKLRFDGFSGEWEEKEVDDIFDILAGGDVPKKELSVKKTQEYSIPILSNGIAEKSLYGWTNKAKINKPSLTVSARGTIGWTSFQEKPFFPIVRLIVLTPKIKINFIYAYYCMKNIENDYKYAKVGIPQLTKPMIKNTKLIMPKDSKEQEKIANCLSSLDNLLEEQNNKIESLKKHKKGLMQQLFINSEGN